MEPSGDKTAEPALEMVTQMPADTSVDPMDEDEPVAQSVTQVPDSNAVEAMDTGAGCAT